MIKLHSWRYIPIFLGIKKYTDQKNIKRIKTGSLISFKNIRYFFSYQMCNNGSKQINSVTHKMLPTQCF